MPIIVAALAASKNSSSVFTFEQLIVDRLHACQPDLPVSSQTGQNEISTHGLTRSSVLSDQTKPGSPNSLTDCISSENCSFVVSSRTNKAELFDRPRCGFSANQLPVLACAISLSSGENTAIVADLLTPPEITASALCIIIS